LIKSISVSNDSIFTGDLEASSLVLKLFNNYFLSNLFYLWNISPISITYNNCNRTCSRAKY